MYDIKNSTNFNIIATKSHLMKKRNTTSKAEVLHILKESGAALSHDMIQASLTKPIDRATIYRILNSFCEDGEVHKVIGDDSKQYFAFCFDCEKKKEHSHHHFHFRCTQCGTVECLKGDVKVQLPNGYNIDTFNGFVSGQCKSCTAKKEGEATAK